MWEKPWSMKEGFLVGGGLLVVGLLLQATIGPIDWDLFASPVNYVMLALLLALIVAMYLLRKKVYVFEWMMHFQAAIPCLCYAVGLTILMGLTPQTSRGGIPWLSQMLRFWPFVLIYVYLTVILGLTIHRRFRRIFRGQGSMKHDIPFMLNHLGLFIALTTATLGSADMQRVKMITAIGEPEWRAMEQSGAIKEMEIAIELKKFIMETYDNGAPKRFASEIQILTKSGKNIETIVEVNKPYEVDGWKIYQFGYDTQMGAQSQISILELVSDPWLPWVYAGFYMMLAGAALMTLEVLWRRLRNATSKALGVYFGLFVIASLFAYFFFDSYNTKTLVPALQSPWFAPHVFVYIFAYTLLGVAVIIAWWKLADDLVYVSLAFLTIGMLFGALWAKEAWGHYWSWDPKETWAAITWIAYLVYIHYRQIPLHRERLALWMLIISFVLLQMCWWGINYLPSAQGSSVHTY